MKISSILQMLDRVTHSLHSPESVFHRRRQNRVLTEMRQIMIWWNFTDDDLVIGAINIRRDQHAIIGGRMVGDDQQRSILRNHLLATRFIPCDEMRQQPTSACRGTIQFDLAIHSQHQFRNTSCALPKIKRVNVLIFWV
jgi:hypothetical protein